MLKMLIGAAALTLCAASTANAQYMKIDDLPGDAEAHPCTSKDVAAPGATPRGNLDRDIIRRTVPSRPRGGVRVAAGDVNGDGKASSHLGGGSGSGKVSFPPEPVAGQASDGCATRGKATGQIRTNQ